MQLCRDVYHCLPSELAEEDAAAVSKHLYVMAGEARVAGVKKTGRK